MYSKRKTEIVTQGMAWDNVILIQRHVLRLHNVYRTFLVILRSRLVIRSDGEALGFGTPLGSVKFWQQPTLCNSVKLWMVSKSLVISVALQLLCSMAFHIITETRAVSRPNTEALEVVFTTRCETVEDTASILMWRTSYEIPFMSWWSQGIVKHIC